MTSRHAAVCDNTSEVRNIIRCEPGFDPGPDLTLVADDGTAAIGGTWDGTTFTPPAPADPPPDLRTPIEDATTVAELRDAVLAWIDR